MDNPIFEAQKLLQEFREDQWTTHKSGGFAKGSSYDLKIELIQSLLNQANKLPELPQSFLKAVQEANATAGVMGYRAHIYQGVLITLVDEINKLHPAQLSALAAQNSNPKDSSTSDLEQKTNSDAERSEAGALHENEPREAKRKIESELDLLLRVKENFKKLGLKFEFRITSL